MRQSLRPVKQNLWLFTYDAENQQLTAVVNGQTSSYVYDGDGRRVQKTVAGVVTVFVYDPMGELVQEYGAATDAGTKYVYGDALGSTRLETRRLESHLAARNGCPT